MTHLRKVRGAVVLLPAASVIYLGFNAGGFFPGAPGIVAAAVALLLAARLLLAERPLGMSVAAAVVIVSLGLLAVWTLLSEGWSHAPGRALVEFDRALLYVLFALVLATFTNSVERLRWVARSLALGSVVVCGAGLLSRTLPDVWHTTATYHPNRLSFPVTYWNALGLLAGLGMLVCAWMATSEREPRVARSLGAAAIPVLASTMLLTYSRGAIAVTAIGLVVYLAAARPRGAVAGLLATVPPTAVALVVTYDANLISSFHPATAAAAAQGHKVAIAVALSAVSAGWLRLVLATIDTRLARRAGSRRSYLAPATAVVLVAGVVVALALGATSSIGHEYHRFVTGGDALDQTGHIRDRLTDPSNNGRLDLWRAGLKGSDASALHGTGAGTYALLWQRYRPYSDTATEGHSLYVETLGELGIVGLVLLVAAILALIVGVAVRVRGPDRALYAAILAVIAAWAVRAGFDWDWEMPVVTGFALMAGAAAVGAHSRVQQKPGWPRSSLVRAAIAIGIVVIAITPAKVAVSQARLDSGVSAFKRGDCGSAINSALGAAEADGSRPEPFELLGYCDYRLGRSDLAEAAMRDAIQRDPNDWEFHYGLALVQAGSGQDPRPQLRRAHALNPLEPVLVDAIEQLRGHNPRSWRTHAAKLAIPLR